jgi:hypothetical protein
MLLTYGQYKNGNSRVYHMGDRRIFGHNVRMLVRENDPNDPNPRIIPQGRRIETEFANHTISIAYNEHLTPEIINSIFNTEIQHIREQWA